MEELSKEKISSPHLASFRMPNSEKEKLTLKQSIYQACRADDVSKIGELIDRHKIKPNSIEVCGGWNLLHVAAQCNASKIVDFLVTQKKYDINALTPNGSSLLAIATKMDSLDVVKLLLDNMSSQNKGQKKPNNAKYSVEEALEKILQEAQALGSANAVKYIVSLPKLHMITILLAIISNDNVKFIDFLVNECKYDFSAILKKGSPVEMAVAANAVRVLKYFKENNLFEFATITKGLAPLLHIAASNNAKDTFDYIYTECSLPLFDKDKKGESPAYYAALNNAKDILIYIGMDKGKKEELLTYRSVKGETLLHVAAKNDSIDVFALLVEWGADIKAVNNSGNTPLKSAAFHDAISIMTYLVEQHGLDVAEKDKYNISLLQLAAQSGALRVFNFLEAKGLKSETKDCFGYDALVDAVRGCQGFTIVKYLIEQKNRDPKKKYSINYQDYGTVRDVTLMHMAAAEDADKVAEYLHKFGVSEYSRNSDGDTALHEAAYEDSIAFLKLFLEKKNAPKLKELKTLCCKEGKNLLHAAVIGSGFDVARYLVDKYPELLFQVDSEHKTPLMYASKEFRANELFKYIEEKLLVINIKEAKVCTGCRLMITNANKAFFSITDTLCLKPICEKCKVVTKVCKGCLSPLDFDTTNSQSEEEQEEEQE